MVKSRWRSLAREEIAAVLAALPAGSSRRDAERALRPLAADFNAPGTSWPGKCWLRERTLALDARFPPVRKAEPPPAVTFRLEVGPWRLDDAHLPFPWLSVACGWCREHRPGGCLMCLDAHEAVLAAVADPVFRALRAALADDPSALGPLKDFLEEHGIEAVEERS